MLFVVEKCKTERDHLIQNNIEVPHELSKRGNIVIINLDWQAYESVQLSDLIIDLFISRMKDIFFA